MRCGLFLLGRRRLWSSTSKEDCSRRSVVCAIRMGLEREASRLRATGNLEWWNASKHGGSTSGRRLATVSVSRRRKSSSWFPAATARRTISGGGGVATANQTDGRLRKAMLQRTRVASRPLEIGESVHFWHKPKNRHHRCWTGPAVIVGKEAGNYWLSKGGRCRLTSPEHIRPTMAEEVGALLAMKGTQKKVERLLDHDPDEAYEDDEKEYLKGLFEDLSQMIRLSTPGTWMWPWTRSRTTARHRHRLRRGD